MRSGWRIVCAVSLVGIALYVVLPEPLESVFYTALSLAAVIALVNGVRTYQPTNVLPWRLLTVAFALNFVGETYYSLHDLVTADPLPAPSFADAFYLPFYPLVGVALMLFLRAAGRADLAAWLDATVWGIGAAVLAWEPLIEPAFVREGGSWTGSFVASAYPLLDVVLFAMATRLAIHLRSNSPSAVLVAVAMLLFVVADGVYGSQVLAGSYRSGDLLDIGWLLGYLCMTAAVSHPSMVSLTEPVAGPTRLFSQGRILALGAPALLVPAVLTYQLATGQFDGQVRDGIVIVVAMTVVLLAAVARGVGLVKVASSRTAQLRSRTAQLERALADRERTAAELQRRVDHDTLTGLASRDRFVEVLEEAVAVGGPPPSILFLDLDDFKLVNDTLGHQAGDTLLIEAADRLVKALDEDCVLAARFGGDEFAVLTRGDAEPVAERLLRELKAPLHLPPDDREVRLGVSIGVATAGGTLSAADLLREADVAMYVAKTSRQGWARYVPGMSALLLNRLDLRGEIDQALTDGQFAPWYQPIVDLRDGRVIGFEALVRWHRFGRDPLPPAEWLGIAEQSGLITRLDRQVITQAVDQLRTWRERYGELQLTMAVNVSGRTLQDAGFEHELLHLLADSGVPAHALVVEVTEGVHIEGEDIARRLQRLRLAGVQIALDDFGTRWSSLAYLRRFPVDLLKLDRSFTSDLGHGADSDAIPIAVVNLSRSLHMGLIAEGVETPLQRDRLLEIGCRQAQGFLFGRPLPAAAQDDVLRRGAVRSVTQQPA